MTKQRAFLFFLLIHVLLIGQKPHYYKNKHVKYEVDVKDGNYEIDYTFMGITNSLISIHLSMPIKSTDRAIRVYGVPQSLLGSYKVTDENIRKRKMLMKAGLFRQVKDVLKPDYNALISYYSPLVKPISKLIVDILKKNKMDSGRNRIELAMRFVQDIPYKVPPDRRESKVTAGLFSPPEILVNAYGDCDSKTILFISILRYLIAEDRILILEQKNHMLSAVKAKPNQGSVFIRYRGNKYLIAETAGPGHWLLGEKGGYFSDRFIVFPLQLN